ncbi:hypothetical protein [Nocardia testacea]|uniref:hypothetical protein n=1 Tax=Nocardia testacea TaxID=248551 RepID=UPI003A85E7F5
MTTIEPGHVEISREHAPTPTRQHQSFHAGALEAIADTAGARRLRRPRWRPVAGP